MTVGGVLNAISGNILAEGLTSQLKGYGVKPYVILAVGGVLTYLALTGKADGLFKSVFGKVGK